MINNGLHKIPQEILSKVDVDQSRVLSGFGKFDYQFNPGCGFLHAESAQFWHFEGVGNRLQEVLVDFEKLFVFVEPGAEVILDLKFSNDFDFDRFDFESVLNQGSKLKLNVLIELEGEKNVGFDLHNKCVEKFASADLNLVYDLLDKSRISLVCETSFEGSDNTGQMMINGILDDKAVGEVDGKIFISEKANKTDSSLQQKVLLLSDDCRNLITPALEILTDDVKAAHGVSVSQVPEDVMFYLNTRGLDLLSAKKLYKDALKKELFKVENTI